MAITAQLAGLCYQQQQQEVVYRGGQAFARPVSRHTRKNAHLADRSTDSSALAALRLHA
jgi:hypothetical protein